MAQVALGVTVASLAWWSVLVWSGRARGWFYGDAGWHTHGGGWVLWPGPIVVVLMAVTLPMIGALEWVLSRWNAELPVGPAASVAVGVQVLLGLFPRPWMFPPWVHARLTPLPDTFADDDRRFVALHSRGCPFGGGNISWLVGFDAVAGVVTLEGDALRFEASGPLPQLPAEEKHRHYSTIGLRPLTSRCVGFDDVAGVSSLPPLVPARRRPGAVEIRTVSGSSMWLLVGDQRAAVRRIEAAVEAATGGVARP